MGHILGALAEFERSLIVERTQAGLKAAKKRGVKLGRRPTLSDDQRKHARELLAKGENPAAVAKLLNVCRATLYNSLKDEPLCLVNKGKRGSQLEPHGTTCSIFVFDLKCFITRLHALSDIL